MNIAAYCRVSTDNSDQLNSLETQKLFFSEYVQRTGDNLVRIYADEGISGTKIKARKEFQKLMQDATTGLFDMVVVKDISRFARNTVDFLQSIRALKALGIETQFLTANMTSMGNSEFVLTIFGALAQEESANTSKRIKFGRRVNAERGSIPNLVYGYDKIYGNSFSLKINLDEAAVVREIFKLYIEDGYGAKKIANELNSRGYRTKRDCMWSQNGICRILSNELYVGRVVNCKQEVADFLTGERRYRDESEWLITDKPELAIISEDTLNKAKAILANRKEAFANDKTRHSTTHMFSTLIKCKECGYSYRQMVRKYKKTHIRWVCSRHNIDGNEGCANAVSVDENELIEALRNYFTLLVQNKKHITKNIVSEYSRAYMASDENAQKAKVYKAKLTKLESRRAKFLVMYADELITRDELNEKLSGIDEEIEKLENELKLSKYNTLQANQLTAVLENTFSEIENITDVAAMSNTQMKQIISKIEVDSDGNVDIYLRLLGDLGLDNSVLE